MLILSPKKVWYLLLTCIGVLLLLHLTSYINFYMNNGDTGDFFFRKTNFSMEKNAPSIFSSLQIFFASILLFTIAFGKLTVKKNTIFWFLLGALFLFLGLDELLRIHEKIAGIVEGHIETSGFFMFSWVIPYAIGLLIVAFFCIKPLFQLPNKTRWHFIMAGVIFVSGALCLEMLAGWYIENKASWYIEGVDVDMNIEHRTLPIFIMYTFEELLEKLGIAFFIYGILKFKKEYHIKNS